MSEESKKKNIKTINMQRYIVYLLLCLITSASIILCSNYGFFKMPSFLMSTTQTNKLTIFNDKVESKSVGPISEEKTYSYEEDPAYYGVEFFEHLDNIQGQNIYVASPITVDESNLPGIVIYSHGSGFEVSNKVNNEFMLDLQEYANFFTQNNYIFAASNQHGDSWGDKLSVEDTRLLIEYINENYKTSGNIYMIGFSMGGVVTMHYTMQYPQNIEAVALLAPTSYTITYNSGNISNFDGIEIKIWHGNKDVNVFYDRSESLIQKFAQLGKKIELVTVEGAGHWDLDTEFMDEILEFFEESK